MNTDVLVVDDSLTVRAHLVQMLRAAGLGVTASATAADARQALACKRFGLIILDVILPDGDGIEILRELRAEPATASVPVMLLSTEAEVRDRIRGMEVGADEYLGKPYEASYLLARARELLQGGGTPDGGGQATILVIDSSLTSREALRTALEERSFRVLTARTGEEGLRLAASERPSAVVVDSDLLDLDGAAVVRRIRLDAALRRTPCLLLTTSEEPAAEVRALDAGADALLRKDGNLAVIQARLAALLRGGTGPPGDECTPGPLGPKRLLVVEAEPAYLQGLSTALRGEGYETAVAHSGEEALALLGVQPVDCILLDWLIPGMGALETCQRLKASVELGNIPVLVFTSIEDREVALRAIEAGADDYMSQRTDLEVLRARVRAQIRRKHAADASRRARDRLVRHQVETRVTAAVQAKSEEQLRTAQEALARGERLHALGQMATGIAHDLRNLLNPLGLRLEMARRALARQAPEKAQESLLAMDHLLKRAVETLERLRDFGRQAPEARLEPTDLNRVAREAVQIARTRLSGETSPVVVQEELGVVPTIPADESELLSSFVNLIANAIDAMPQGGRVLLRTGTGDGGAVAEVSDDGPGMGPEVKARLFEPFFTTKGERGTGMGLAMVYAAVQRHGGSICVQSEPGRGTTFRLWFPASPR